MDPFEYVKTFRSPPQMHENILLTAIAWSSHNINKHF